MSSLNQKMIDLATAIRTKRGLANNNLLSLDEMIEQIYLLEHDFYKQAATGTTTYTAMSVNLKTLAPYAFYGLQGINTMTFTNSELTSISDYVLKDSSVTTVSLPATVTSIGESAFENTPLTKITASGVSSAGKACFKNTALTTSPTMPNLKVLPEEFCAHTKNYYGPLTKISIPTGCTRIEPAAFNNLLKVNEGNPLTNWSKFQNFSGPNVEHIGTDNFKINGFGAYEANTQYLVPTVLNFPKLKTLKHYCFYFGAGSGADVYWKYYKDGYYKVNFSSLETMGHLNFYHFPFKQITSVEFPALKSIGQNCFCNNDMLTIVNLPLLETIKPASKEAKYGTEQADDYPQATVCYKKSPWSNCPNLEKLLLPSFTGSFTIDLEGCTGLKTLDVGQISAFHTFETSSLQNLIIRNETPPTLYYTWIQGVGETILPTTINIYVPDPSLYENLNNWQYYYQLGCIKPLSEYKE